MKISHVELHEGIYYFEMLNKVEHFTQKSMILYFVMKASMPNTARSLLMYQGLQFE